MKYYSVTYLVEVPEEVYTKWDAGCDETFHFIGPMVVDDPTRNIRLYDYQEHTLEEFKVLQSEAIENEDGGI